MVEPELGARKISVLRAVVEEYVRTGEPVGSETIAEQAGLGGPGGAGPARAGRGRPAERGGLGARGATIRNEMSALEELGSLGPPHPSAGISLRIVALE